MASCATVNLSDLFGELEQSVVACEATGAKIIKLLSSDVSTLDDSEPKRAKLAARF